MNRFADFVADLDQLREDGRLRQLVPQSIDGPYLVDDQGHRRLNFGGNDYLGIVAEPPITALSTETTASSGGSTASALVCGWSPLHDRLARQIAAFESTPAATLFPSGFAACSGTVATLAGDDDLVLSDQLNHASLIDGCRLSRAARVIYPHRSVRDVTEILRTRRHEFRRVWIVTDGVFSMDGHIAPLSQLCDVAEQYDADLIVDEAHGTGVLGESGSGLCEATGTKSRVTIRIGTLSKAIGCQGGFVAGPKPLIDTLINRCRPLIYSTSLSPLVVQAAIDSLAVIRSEPQRREMVTDLARRFRDQIASVTGTLSHAHPGHAAIQPNELSELERGVPIIPVHIGADSDAVRCAGQLADRGFFVPAIRPPTVPSGTARLRVSLSAVHTASMIDDLAAAIREICRV